MITKLYKIHIENDHKDFDAYFTRLMWITDEARIFVENISTDVFTYEFILNEGQLKEFKQWKKDHGYLTGEEYHADYEIQLIHGEDITIEATNYDTIDDFLTSVQGGNVLHIQCIDGKGTPDVTLRLGDPNVLP